MQFRYQWQIQSRAASLLFTGAVLLFISYIFVALSAKDTYYAHRLATDGRMVTATVIKKILHRASNSGISNTSYEVTYFFGTLDGGKVVGSYTVDSDTWERTAEHDPVEVLPFDFTGYIVDLRSQVDRTRRQMRALANA